MKLPDDWNDPDHIAFNIANLIFWAITMGVFLFLISKYA